MQKGRKGVYWPRQVFYPLCSSLHFLNFLPDMVFNNRGEGGNPETPFKKETIPKYYLRLPLKKFMGILIFFFVSFLLFFLQIFDK